MSQASSFAEAIREGLTGEPKRVSPQWLYDERGSKLFEQITGLPEYYLTDRERSIFEAHGDAIAAACPEGVQLIELGAGSAEKTRLILEALVDRQGPTEYRPIDISAKALEMARRRFEEDTDVGVRPIEASFEEGLERLDPDEASPRLIAFIGSSIGNMPPDDQRALLGTIQATMREGDRFLLGTDLDKDTDTLLAAYDDRQGVTAEFTLNLLRRANRELGADFDLEAFEHVVRFDEGKSAVESYLESQADQLVHVGDLDLSIEFSQGERVHVEDSYKYTGPMLEALFQDTGLERLETWTDEDGWFAVHLLASA